MSIMATSTPARSPSASASPMTKIPGAGAAASIQAAILANAPMARRRPSMTPRADFGAAIFLPKRAEADFQGWREAQAWTAWKYKMWETGHRLPAQSTSGRARWLGQDASPEGVDQSWLARVRASRSSASRSSVLGGSQRRTTASGAKRTLGQLPTSVKLPHSDIARFLRSPRRRSREARREDLRKAHPFLRLGLVWA
jgi:hypothetical protein